MSPVRTVSRDRRGTERLILRHCSLLDDAQVAPRQPVRIRLEEQLGPALAQRLVSSLSLTRRIARA